MSLALFFAAQHVSNASTFIFRSLRLCVGILHSKHVEQQKIKQVTSVGLSLFNYEDDARSSKHEMCICSFLCAVVDDTALHIDTIINFDNLIKLY